MAERKALEADLVRATEQRAKELSQAELVQSRARLARMQRETAEAIALAKRENAERASLERAMWQGREARARELAQVEKVQSDARLARMRREAAEAKAIARQEAQVAKEAARSRPAQQMGGVAAPGALFNWSVYTTGINQAIALTQRLFYVTSDLVNQAALWERYAVAITTMEGSALVAARSLDDLYQIAKAPGIDLEGANKYYLQLRAVGVEGERAKEIITQFANTVARSGGGGVEFERVNRQLTQMLANGRVLESELKWMKESMPELAKLMQATFGTTTAKGIRDAGISADEFVTRLTSAMAEMPRAQDTLTTAIENTTTAWSMLKASIIDTDGMKSALRTLTELMEGIVAARESAKTQETVSDYFSANSEGDREKAAVREYYRSLNSDLSPAELDALILEKEKRRPTRSGLSNAMVAHDRKTDGSGRSADMDAQTYLTRSRAAGLSEKEIAALVQGSSTTSMSQMDTSFKFYQQTKNAPKVKTEEELEVERKKREEAAALYKKNIVNVDYLDPTGIDNMRYRWNQQRGGSGKETTALAKEEKERLEALRKAEESRKKLIEEQELARKADYLAKRDQMEALYLTEHERELQRLHEEQALILEVTERGSSERERLLAEHYKRVDALQRNHVASNMTVFLDGHATFFDSLSELTKNAAGEQSATYKTMFGISKGFAIASASLNLSKALMDALAQGGTIWEKMAAYGTVAAMGGNLISQINSAAYSGVYDKGGDIPMGKWGIAGENGPEIIQGPAHVTSTKDTAKLLGGAGGGTNVVINNYSSAQVTEKTRSDGSIELLIQEVAAAAEDRISAGIASGSSRVATVMQSVYGVRR